MDASPHAPPSHSPTLRGRYEAYRLAQGRELLNLLPREGLRSLLRHLRSEGPTAGPATLEELARRCSELLPLPPFERWAEDFHSSRGAYVDLPGPPMAPRAPDGSPVTVEMRTLRTGGRSWIAGLALRHRGDSWVGHIRFHRDREERVYRTGEIFHGASPTEVRDRFRSFDEPTLEAFLRSTLP